VDKKRRKILSLLFKGTFASIFLAFNPGKAFALPLPFLPVKRKIKVIPPGGESIAHFTETCTACHICVSVCPAHVIKPALAEYGPSGVFQPVMDYDSSFCNYECVECLNVCPTGALKPHSLEEKKLIALGSANLNKNSCIVYAMDKHCGICAEYCPTGAVYLVPYKKGLPAPETDSQTCIGCGACENACPARPDKAIYVEGYNVQKTAKNKENEPAIKNKTQSGDFPF
jgi:ferredoxin